VIGRSIFEIVPELAQVWDSRMIELRAQRSVTAKVEVVTATGFVTVQHTHALVVREGRELVQAYAFDLTSHKVAQELEEQLATKHRNESLGLVAGGIAHDFNNLLVGVLAEASAIADDHQLTDDLRAALQRIETSAKRMAQLTRQLLAYAGRGRVVTALVDPDVLLSELADPIARAVRGDVRIAIAPGAGSVAIEADPLLLRQVVLNLVANGSDAVGPDGRVTVTSSAISRDGTPWWQLEVGDDGIGLDPTTLARMFDPFFTTKIDRHGLGLSAVQGIVRRLGGHIEVDSAAGKGARFRVRLPIVPGAQPAAIQRLPAAISSPLVGIRVLIADDEPSVRSTVRRLFERRGAIVSVAADGSEAEALLRAEQFGFVLLDIEMPGRRGYELVPIARETQPGTPVLLMSGFTDTRGAVEPDGFLEKPFTSRALDAMIDGLLAKPR
jgi:signal transduction histidine kinase/CheY-like chemotaxis protein